jgi:hypothetical protein
MSRDSIIRGVSAFLFVILLSVQVMGNTPIAYAATIGQSLQSPETGWQRINNDNASISYSGNTSYFNNRDTAAFWKGEIQNIFASGVVKFGFYGTKLRIIAQPYQDRSSSVNVNIDGKDMGTYSAYIATGYTLQALLYEKTGLSLGEHTVIITNKTANYFFWDAIDIDATGYMVAYKEPKPDPPILLYQGMNSIGGNLKAVNYNQTRTLKVSELIPLGYDKL